MAEEVVEVAVAAMVGDGEEVATEVEEVAMVAAVVATEVRLLCIGQQSNIRHEDFRLFVRSCVTLRGHPLDSETGWTGELWSNPVLLISEN